MSATLMGSLLARFDDDFMRQDGVGARTLPVAAVVSSPIPNGLFTITYPDGSYKTFRIFTKKATAKFAPGKRVIALLIGPDNSSDFEGVAFLESDGPRVWKRFKDTKVDLNVRLLCELATGTEHNGYELLVSRRCLVCNRTLTTPTAIERGIGDTCWARVQTSYSNERE